jgi:hypothetical protein
LELIFKLCKEIKTEYYKDNQKGWILCIEKFTGLFCKEFKSKIKTKLFYHEMQETAGNN